MLRSRRQIGEALRELVREQDRHRHQLVGLVGGVAEHHALVAGAAGVDALRDIGRLLSIVLITAQVLLSKP